MPINPRTGEFEPFGGPAGDPTQDPFLFPASAPEKEGEFKWLDTDDALLFAPRAVEGLLRSATSLVTLGKFGDTDDLFVDRIARASLGKAFGLSVEEGGSDSVIGGGAEALTQFLIPFGGITKGLKAAGFLAKMARAPTKFAGLAGFGRSLARSSVAGGLADFVAFDGNEARLANVLIQVPSLRIPMLEFLAAKEDDNEIVGRLKNVLEGAGLGIFFDSLLLGAKAVRTAATKGKRAAKIAAKNAEEEATKSVAQVRREAIELLEVRKAEKAAKASPQASEALKGEDPPSSLFPDGRRPAGTFIDEADGRKTREKDPDVVGEEILNIGDEVDEAADVARRAAGGKAAAAKVRGKATPEGTLTVSEAVNREGADVSAALIRGIKLTDEDIVLGNKFFDELLESNEKVVSIRLGGNPRKLSKEARAIVGLSERGGLNLTTLAADDSDTFVLIRAFEKLLDEKGVRLSRTKGEAESQMEALAEMADMLQATPEQADAIRDVFVSAGARIENAPLIFKTIIGARANQEIQLAGALHDGLENVDMAKMFGLGLGETVQAGPEAIMRAIKVNRLAVLKDIATYQLVNMNLGRGLRSAQFSTVGDDIGDLFEAIFAKAPDLQNIDRLKGELGQAEIDRQMAALAALRNFDNVSAIASAQRLSALSPGKRRMKMTTEWVIHALLWSGRTVTTNAIFPHMVAWYTPFENMIGGATSILAGEAGLGIRTISRELHVMGGMMAAFGDAAVAAKRAFKEGPLLDPKAAREFEAFGKDAFFDPRTAAWGVDTAMSAAIQWISKGLTFPNALMRSGDEFNKTMVARGYAMARLRETAIELGEDPSMFIPKAMDKMFADGRLQTDDVIRERVQKQLQEEGFRDPLQIINRKKQLLKEAREGIDFDDANVITTEALRRAREVTATTPLEEGTVGASVQEFVNKQEWMRLIMPFVRTPTNLVKYGAQRLDPISVPIAFVRKLRGKDTPAHIEAAWSRNMKDLLAGGERAGQARARSMTGLGLFAAAGMYAQSGRITGGGPEDPEQRLLMEDAGWQPYSMLVGDKYFSYLRGDPFAMVLGLAADLFDTTRMAWAEDDVDLPLEAMGIGFIMSIARNLTSRTYLAGARALLDTASRPQQFGSSFLASTLTLGVPRAFGQFGEVLDDPVLKDTHGLINKLRKRVPFFGDVPPMRNMLGEPIRRSLAAGADPDTPASLWLDMVVPVTYREVSTDVLRREFADLSYGFAPPSRKKSGIRLDDFKNGRGQDAYDRWQQLQGMVSVNGRTLRSSLTRLIRQRDYQSLTKQSTAFEPSPRVRLIKSTVLQYRNAAWEQLLREYPDLDSEFRSRTRDRRLLRAGGRPSSLLESFGPFSQR